MSEHRARRSGARPSRSSWTRMSIRGVPGAMMMAIHEEQRNRRTRERMRGRGGGEASTTRGLCGEQESESERRRGQEDYRLARRRGPLADDDEEQVSSCSAWWLWPQRVSHTEIGRSVAPGALEAAECGATGGCKGGGSPPARSLR